MINDCVRREDAVSALINQTCCINVDEIRQEAKCNAYFKGIVQGIDAIQELPAENPRRFPRAKWVNDSDGIPTCSRCGEAALQRLFFSMEHHIFDCQMFKSQFCPFCGAKMVKYRGESI